MRYFNDLYNENDLIIIKEIYFDTKYNTNCYQYNNENKIIHIRNSFTDYNIEYLNTYEKLSITLHRNIPYIANITYYKNEMAINMIEAYKSYSIGDNYLFDSKEDFEKIWKLVKKSFGYLFDAGYTNF